MGQDREFSEEEKRFTLETIERFIEQWEEEERKALAADRDRRLEAMKQQDENDQNDQSIAAEIAGEIEEYEFKNGAKDSAYFQKQFVNEQDEDGNTTMQIISTNDEELRDIETKYKMLKVLAHRFLMLNDWNEMIANLLRYRVMRYPQII